MGNLQIRRLEARDLPDFKAIRLEALRSAPSAFGSTLAEWSLLSDDEWRERLKHPVFAAFRNGEPIGVAGLLRERGSKAAHRATLVMVYLREIERGKGVADELFNAVVAFAKDEGVRQLELNVDHRNATAIRFYLRHGFRQVGSVPAALIDNGEEVDELMMIRVI